MGAPRDRLLLYRLLMGALFPLLALHLLWTGAKGRNGRYLRQRLGLVEATPGSAPIWLHAASVGEVNAALPLIQALRERHPRTRLLLTTSTLAGGATARTRLPPEVEQAFLPLDLPGPVNRFLSRYAPRCGLVMETELWPNLYAACAARAIPLILVNGRLSARTRNAPRWVRSLYAGCLGRVRAILARSEADREGFVALGAPAEAVSVIGNIKFATVARSGRNEIDPITLGRPFLLAASTREGEELRVARAWQRAGGAALLVIVPRHPRRLARILADLAPLGERIAVRSRGEAVTPDLRLYVADTLGELERFMAGAELVFMGGSLVPKGGHNLLEPARLGRAVVVGPHMENFTDETALLLREGAVVQVGDEESLAQTFRELLADPGRRAALGERAQRALLSRGAIAAEYAEAIERLSPCLD